MKYDNLEAKLRTELECTEKRNLKFEKTIEELENRIQEKNENIKILEKNLT